MPVRFYTDILMNIFLEVIDVTTYFLISAQYCIVYHNCTDGYAYTYDQLLQMTVCYGRPME